MMTVEHYTHTFVPASTPDLPTLVLLHGTGGNESSLLDIGASVLPGAAQLSPRGQVLEHGMPRFFRRFAEGQFDLVDLAERTAELGAWMTAALAKYGVADQPIVMLGYSNGANTAAELLLTGAARAEAAVLLRPMLVHRPASVARLDGLRVLIESGSADRITPMESAAELGELLRSAGAVVEQIVHENIGHQLVPADVRRANSWLLGR